MTRNGAKPLAMRRRPPGLDSARASAEASSQSGDFVRKGGKVAERVSANLEFKKVQGRSISIIISIGQPKR